MAEFHVTITDGGIELLSKGLQGKAVTFTSLVLGDGTYAGSAGQAAAVVSPKQVLAISRITRKESQATVRGVLRFQEVETGFTWRELGLLARDPDSGAEVLYAYGNAGSQGDYIPGASEATLDEKTINLTVAVSSAENVTAVLDPSFQFVGKDELEAVSRALEDHIGNGEIHVTAVQKADWDGKAAGDHGHTAATPETSGFMTALDKTKLAGIEAGATKYQHPATHPVSMITETNALKIMTAAEREKLAGVQAGATNYQHPASHPASMITEDAAHRFATDAEKSAWNGKAAGNHNHAGVYDPVGTAANVQKTLDAHTGNAALHVPQTMVTATLITAGWTGTPPKQTVNVAGASVSGQGVVMPFPAAGDSYDAWCDSGVKALPLTTDGKLTFQAESKPAKAITVVVEVKKYGSS